MNVFLIRILTSQCWTLIIITVCTGRVVKLQTYLPKPQRSIEKNLIQQKLNV